MLLLIMSQLLLQTFMGNLRQSSALASTVHVCEKVAIATFKLSNTF